jgi:hypothetical protein
MNITRCHMCSSAPSYRVGVIVSFVLLICSSFLCPLFFYSDAAEIFFSSSRIPFTSAFIVVFTQTRSAVNCSALLLSNPRCTWYRDWRIHLGIMLNQVKSENKDCNSCHSPIVSVSLWSCRTKWSSFCFIVAIERFICFLIVRSEKEVYESA